MPTYVTRPFLPELQEFIPYLENIWESRVLSNGGRYHVQLEHELCEFLKVNHVCLFNNGTLGLLVALKALEISQAEVITTPYSFVATSSTLLWSGNTPVFVDIDPMTSNIDASKIEASITPRTKAILAVHCYGRPCNTEKIERIAKAHNLKVIYDAAHAFGVETPKGSILNQGDLSVLSFHATKSFNTFEGGAVICHSHEMKSRIDRLKNFGFTGEVSVGDVGINAKMNEFSAALGVLQLKHFKESIKMRAEIDRFYRNQLGEVVGISCLENNDATSENYNYFPILVTSDYPIDRDELYERLKSHDIYARRYFYPLISNFEFYKNFPSSNPENLAVATKMARQVLCLPIFPEMDLKVVSKICDLLKSFGV